jgi:hypothetical protein
MGVDNKGINKIVGLSLKNNKALEQIANASVVPNQSSVSNPTYSINVVRALDIEAKKASGKAYQNYSPNSSLKRSSPEVLHNIFASVTGEHSKNGYPQPAQKSIEGIEKYIRSKEDNLASAVGFKPQRSSNLSGDALVNNLTERLGQVTRMMGAYKDIAKFNLPGKGTLS